MEAKHKPATTLPWFATAQVCKGGMRVVSAVGDRGVARDCHKGDAAYIAHTANAYPKLVEVVRGMLDANDHGSVSNIRTATEAMRALLDGLGEAGP